MKTRVIKILVGGQNAGRHLIISLAALLLLTLFTHNAFAQDTTTSTAQGRLNAGSTAAIPFDQIGAVAGKQYSGDGLAVASSPEGARLHCAFQRLNADATTEGLWLASTADGAKGKPFRVMAQALGRAGTETLPLSGKVETAGQLVRFMRPGLTEEYSVGIDGLQQDFVIEQRPPGNGSVRLELKVDGAKAEAMAGGARLVLDDGGRQMVYDRLKAVDARGRELTVKMEVMSASRLAVVLDDAAAEYPVRIDPTFSDANWISFGGLPGVAGAVLATAVDNNGNLYVGGGFTVGGDGFANNVAQWNGTSWAALGSGISGNVVYALAVSGTNLFAGGIFTSAGGVSATNIAEWNGTSWSALGSGMNGQVNALAVSGTNLFVGGVFDTAGGVPADSIAEWNGSSWSALGSGISGIVADVFALAVSDTNLFVGGEFTAAGGVSATNIAEWNGSSWSALGSGMNRNGYVLALTVLGTDLFAGGEFTSAGGVSANYIAQWNGSSWSALGSGMSGGVSSSRVVSALAVSGTNVFAGGAFTNAGGIPANYVAQWNGSSWSALNSELNSSVRALTVSGANLFAGGTFTSAGGVSATGIAQWNGNSWSAFGSGMNSIINALAVSGTNVFAGGYFTSAGGVSANYIAQWNGNSWSALGSGMNSYVYALAVSGTNLFAGGYFTNAGGVSANYIAQWNGSSWSALGSGMNGNYVLALAVSGTNLFVGGEFTSAGGVAATNIAEWNGSSWSALGSGMNSYVWALAVSGTNLFAGGAFTSAGGVSANYIAQWNGSSWSALGSGLNNASQALAVSGNNLFVGGQFTTAGGMSANYIAQWNGSSWSALGSGMNGIVFALAVSGTNVFAGGYFTSAGGVSANHIAQWNGSSWSALGSGVDNVVYALAVSGNNLYVGGDFTTAGTNVSAYIAEANFTAPAIVSQPASETLPIGDAANFGVSVTGYLPLYYQWYFNTNAANLLTPDSLLSGATNANLVFGPAILNDVGNYQVIVTNSYGSATSTVATLTVLLEPNLYNLSNNIAGGSTTVYLASFPGSTNRLWATTNLSLPFSVIATNVADSNGLFQFLDPTTAGIKAKFYRLSVP
jgi:Immunoglobulin I-set domain